MTIDAIYGSRRYDDQLDKVEDQPPPKPAPSETSGDKQARIIESSHGEIHYPPEMFAQWTPTNAHKDLEVFHRLPVEKGPPVIASSVATPATPAGKLYTTNPNEVATQKTKLPTPEVVAKIRAHWPELTEQGARTLAAQWAAETNFGDNCYGNNFGNVKGSDKSTHQYLRGIWEFPTPRTAAAADKMVADAKGLAHLASPEFKAKKGYPADAPIVVFDPPHPQCRFKAYATADEGMAAYVAMQKNIAGKHPDYLDALNMGDVAATAHVLAGVKYATTKESDYRAGMQRAKNTIDKQLGPAA